jgi:hypothetical protein
MKNASRTVFALIVAVQGALPALAQDEEPERIPFADGELTITQTPDYEKVLAFDGRELAREYFVFFDRIADVEGTEVAFVYVGPGGNACSPSVTMVWKPQDEEVSSQITEEDCATPSPAISDSSVFFVPYLLPGDQADVTRWAPGEGFSLHGRIAYAPQPDTSWATFDPASIGHPLDLFGNADIYAASQALLGDELSDVTIGLGTAGQPEIAPGGMLWARGCVPHACGVSDTFLVVDPAGQAVYFAQQGDETRFWPDRAGWPQSAAVLLPDDF